MRGLQLTCAALVTFLAASVWADEFDVSASISSDVVEVGQPLSYSVTVATQGSGEIRLVEAPNFGTLKVLGQQQMPQFININGNMQRRVTLQYQLRATKVGEVTIAGPAFSAHAGKARAPDKTVTVVEAGKAPRPKPKKRNDVYIEVGVDPNNREPWVGEQVLLSYDLLTDARQMDAHPTQMTEPSLDEFWIEDLSEQSSGSKQLVSADGRLMERKALRTYALFPLRAGHVSIEPMELSVVIGNFFRRGSEFTVASEPIELEIKPLPPEAPASFAEGNVGRWKFFVRTSESATRVGRAIRVEVTASGEGQLGRVKLPALPNLPNARISEPEEELAPHVRNNAVGGLKKVVYSVTPLAEGTLTIPELEFSYFDTREDKYVTVRSEAREIKVAAGTLPPAPIPTDDLARRNISGGEDMVEKLAGELLPLRAEARLSAADDPGDFGWWWWVLGLGSLTGFLGVWLHPTFAAWRARRAPLKRRRAARDAAIERVRAAGTNPSEITAAIRDLLADVYDIGRGVVTSNEIRSAFERAGLPEEAAAELEWVLKQCEEARFAPDGGVSADVADRAATALAALPMPTAADNVAAAAIVFVAVLSVAVPARAETMNWAAKVQENPSSVDALYNLGTQAAANEDFGTARWALERAAWLAPTDSDIEHNRHIVERIVRIKGIELSRTGRTIEGDEMLFWWNLIASIPAWMFGASMLIGWLAATSLLVLRRRSDSLVVRDAAFVGLVLAICLGAFATAATILRESVLQSADPAVVVVDSVELREGPNLAARAKRPPASMVPGTLLRVADQREEWVKLTWPGGAGWTTEDAVRRIVVERSVGR